ASRIPLQPGEYVLEVDADVHAGSAYAGILDIDTNHFITQGEVGSGRTAIPFALTCGRVVDIVIRQGDDDGEVTVTYRGGRLSARGVRVGCARGARRHPRRDDGAGGRGWCSSGSR